MLIRSTLAVLLAISLIGCNNTDELAETSPREDTILANAKNEDALVKDKESAIEIAVNEWIRMGLKEMIEQEKPYRAELVGEVWEVAGTAPKNWVGGLAYARISQKDGKVLGAWHDK